MEEFQIFTLKRHQFLIATHQIKGKIVHSILQKVKNQKLWLIISNKIIRLLLKCKKLTSCSLLNQQNIFHFRSSELQCIKIDHRLKNILFLFLFTKIQLITQISKKYRSNATSLITTNIEKIPHTIFFF